MKNVYIYCEGQTEESFINEILYPYFLNINIYITPIICTTKRTLKKKYKGGVTDYKMIKDELTILCKQHKNEVVTTMFDYYGMPNNAPYANYENPDLFERVELIEQKITQDIGQANCFFGLMIHEFEGLLFSNPHAFKSITNETTVEKVQRIRDSFETPEYINNSTKTAPSKRLQRLIPRYAKVRNGTILSKEIGIDRMLAECKHFANWIEKIKRFN